MGIFHKLHKSHTIARPHHKSDRVGASRARLCRIEPLESRQLLSVSPATIHIGATYLEDGNAKSTPSVLATDSSVQVADIFQVGFTSTAGDTTLTKLVIDLGQSTIFDVSSSDTLGTNADGSFALKILCYGNNDGHDGFTIDWSKSKISSDGLRLELYLTDFEEGEKLVFTVDVDEGDSPLADGGEFDGTDYGSFELTGATLSATFDTSHMEQKTAEGIAFSCYELRSDDFFTGTDLYDILPDKSYSNDAADSYLPVGKEGAGYQPANTAGVYASVTQDPLSTISGHVYDDADGSGVYTPLSEEVELQLYVSYDGGATYTAYKDNDGNVATTTTVDGYYIFKDLPDGTYQVREVQPNDYANIKAVAGTVDNKTRGTVDSANIISSITLNSEDSVDNDFIETQFSISGYVYYDADADGIRDTGESGIDGVKLYLYKLGVDGTTYVAVTDDNGDPITYTTGSNGYYIFKNLAPGTYCVKEGTEAKDKGYLDGTDKAGKILEITVGTAGNDVINAITLDDTYTAGASFDNTAENYNFGELGLSISGRAYVDIGVDHVYVDGTDIALEYITINLLDSSGNVIDSTTTDADGKYSFTNLPPGTYGVQQVYNEEDYGYIDWTDYPGNLSGTAGNDLITNISLTTGISGTDYDFTEILPASISGRVFVDADGNGAYDSGETTLKDVWIYLYDDAGNLVDKIQTSPQGKYSFTGLKPGVYTVKEALTPAYLEGGTGDQDDFTAGGTPEGYNSIVDATLTAGASGLNYDFYEIEPAAISGYVFQDGSTLSLKKGTSFTNPSDYGYTGSRTSDDTALSSGVTLYLYDSDGKLVATTTPGADGYYEFDGLYAGSYSVVLKLSSSAYQSYYAGIDTVGSSGGTAINTYNYASLDAGTLSILSSLGSLTIDETDRTIVTVNLSRGESAVEYNFSEVLVVYTSTPPKGPPTPPPAPPTLPPTYTALPFAEYVSYGNDYTFYQEVNRLMSGGSGGPGGYSWHLSVIDAGQPRQENSDSSFVQDSQSTYFDPASWSGGDMAQGQWVLADKDGKPIKTLHYGTKDAKPVTGDWDGSGITKIGVFMDGQWFLDLDGDGLWDNQDLWAKLGKKSDQPVTGDWDGDGKTDIGIYGLAWIGDVKAINVEPGLPDAQNPPKNRPKNVPPDPADATVGYRTMKKERGGKMRSDVIDHVFQYGTKNDQAITGDWNGDDINTVGIFRKGVWFLDMDGDGRWSDGDVTVEYGQEGDIPVVGDWTGDGIAKLGVYRNGTFYLDTNNNREIDATDKVFQLGSAGDRPIVGDWTGDGVDKVGVYQANAAPENQTASAASTTAAVK